MRRNVARLTVLGDPVLVRARADELGIDFDGIDIINPLDSELVDEFADAYHQLRKHKGIDEEAARDIVRDVSYFGTMMVHLGKADGMVSGPRTPRRTPSGRRSRSSRPNRACRRSRRVLHVPGRPGSRVR